MSRKRVIFHLIVASFRLIHGFHVLELRIKMNVLILAVFSAKLSSGEKDQNFLFIVNFLVAERKKLVTFAALSVAVSNLAGNN